MLVYQRVVENQKKTNQKIRERRGRASVWRPPFIEPAGRPTTFSAAASHVFCKLPYINLPNRWKLSGVISTTYPLRKPPGAENLETRRAQILIPSGKRLHNYGKSPFLTGKSTKFLWPFSSSLFWHNQRVSLGSSFQTFWDEWLCSVSRCPSSQSSEEITSNADCRVCHVVSTCYPKVIEHRSFQHICL